MAIRADLTRDERGPCATLTAICQLCVPIPQPGVSIAEPHMPVGRSSMHTPL